jgi:hypothetical protein
LNSAELCLFNDLVSAGEKRVWHVDTKGLGGLHIDHQFELGELLDRKAKTLVRIGS